MATIPTQNAVPSEAPRDLKFNSGKIDEFVTSLEHEYKDRFGRCHMTIEGMRWIFEQLMARFKVDINQAIIAAGYIPMDSFQQGAEITKRNEILRDETTGEYYRWDGDLPKSVPAGSTPESAGGVGMGAWVSVGDASLRSDLSGIIKNTDSSTHEMLKASSDKSEIILSTWNIQSFSVIVNRYNREPRDWKRFFDLSEFILNTGSHIVGMQECYSAPFARMDSMVSFPYKSGYFGTAQVDEANTTYAYESGIFCLSSFKISESETKIFIDDGGYNRVVSRSIIQHPSYGKIAIYNLHSGWFELVNKSISDYILTDLEILDVDKCVVFGYFNHDNINWFGSFISAGFEVLNKGEYNTKNSTDGSEWFIDNILIKGMIAKKIEVFTPDETLSDHKMLTAHLVG